MKMKTEIVLEYLYPDGRREPAGPVECNDICWPMWRALGLGGYNSSARTWALPTKRDLTTQVSSGMRWYLFYGSKDCKQLYLNSQYAHDAIIQVEQDTPVWTAGATANDPGIMTFTAVIPAPVGSSRTIRVMGLEASGSSGVQSPNDVANGKMTILRLSSPCTQTTSQTLVVTYRLYLYPSTGTSNIKAPNRLWEDFLALAPQLCNAVAATNIGINTPFQAITTSSYRLDSLSPCAFASPDPGGVQTYQYCAMELTDLGASSRGVPTLTAYTNALSGVLTLDTTDTYGTGAFIKTVMASGGGLLSSQGNATRRVFSTEQAIPGLASPLQNIFAQRNSPPGPFQDLSVGNTATMSGTLNLSHGTWTDPGYQQLVRFNITASGNVGVATYTVETCLFIAGFAGNRWIPRTALFPQKLSDATHIRKPATEVVHEQYLYAPAGSVSYRSPDGYRYVLAADCTRTQSGVTVYDLIAGSKKNFNSQTTPALSVTAVADGDVAKGYIFVACANTGLWRINPALDTVEHITSPTGTEKAYQIAVKEDVDNTVWVLFDGGLCKLTNPDAAVGSLSWTIYNTTQGSPLFSMTGITDGNWDKVTSMVINPTAMDNQFLMVTSGYPDTSGSYKKAFVWWNTSGAGAANPATGGVAYQGFTWSHTNLLRQAESIVCVGDQWLIPMSNSVYTTSTVIHRAAFGAATLDATYFSQAQAPRPFKATINGQRGVIVGLGPDRSIAGTSYFIKDSIISTIPSGTAITAASPYVEFALRNGNTSAINTIENNVTNAVGMLSRPLVYLPNSNLFFTYEYFGTNNGESYGVTPFMLPPTHTKYAAYKDAFWKKYGWDGSVFVLGNTNGRPVHSTTEVLPMLNNMGVSFTDGAGTSFVSGEWFITVIGLGVSKDNGTSFTHRVTVTPEACAKIDIASNVPTAALGLRTDEPLTFTPASPDTGSTTNSLPLFSNVQCKGVAFLRPSTLNDAGTNNLYIADQLIPASTDFDLRFKWTAFIGSGTASSYKGLGLATGTGSYTYGYYFRFNQSTGNLELYNNTTLVTTVTSPSVDAVCRITRVGTTISAYYDGTLLGTTTSSSQFVIMARNGGGNSTTNPEAGWWDMKLTYTESRRVLIVGSSGAGTGYYNSRFAGLIANSVTGSNQIYIGSGSPLTAIMDYSTAGVALAGTGRIKVAAGAGWLIFHDSEPANPITGYAHALYHLNNL